MSLGEKQTVEQRPRFKANVIAWVKIEAVNGFVRVYIGLFRRVLGLYLPNIPKNMFNLVL